MSDEQALAVRNSLSLADLALNHARATFSDGDERADDEFDVAFRALEGLRQWLEIVVASR
jgi:hypothetical protein